MSKSIQVLQYFISKLFKKNWDQRSLKIHITTNTGLYNIMGYLTEVLRNVSWPNEKQIGCFGQVTG
jgi:hypothetical protein